MYLGVILEAMQYFMIPVSYFKISILFILFKLFYWPEQHEYCYKDFHLVTLTEKMLLC